MRIPFNKAFQFPREETLVLEALRSGGVCGNRAFGQKAIAVLRAQTGALEPFLAPSCTAAMEMGSLLADLQPGDEVILPSYTFSSTVNAIVLRGCRPVFCEIDPLTLNADPSRMEELVTPRTRMILPIDYAGIPCDMDPILAIAERHGLVVMQDAAQSYGATYKGRPVGSYAPLVAFSFHETKNNSCGEGGALCVNRADWIERGHFIQEKGTDRRLVLLGQKVKYSWVDVGSSFLLADLLAAVLLVQLEENAEIMRRRARVTDAYRGLLQPYADKGHITIPTVPDYAEINHHAFWAVFGTTEERHQFLAGCADRGVLPYIGYLPLHSAPKGRTYGYAPEDLPLTESIAARVARLPMYTGLADDVDFLVDSMGGVLRDLFGE